MLRHLISDLSTASSSFGQRRNKAFSALAPSMRELMAKAEMNSGAEGNMAVRLSLEIELLRICVGLRIQVCGCQHRHDLLTLP